MGKATGRKDHGQKITDRGYGLALQVELGERSFDFLYRAEKVNALRVPRCSPWATGCRPDPIGLRMMPIALMQRGGVEETPPRSTTAARQQDAGRDDVTP